MDLSWAFGFSSLVIFTSQISISIECDRKIDYTTIQQTTLHVSVKAMFCLKTKSIQHITYSRVKA